MTPVEPIQKVPAIIDRTPQEQIAWYQKKGLRVFYFERTGDPANDWKKATGKAWNRRDLEDDWSQFDPAKHNVGTITGVEVKPGRFLVDIDLDGELPPWPILNLLPVTEFVFGRSGKSISHLFYTFPERLPSVKEYKDIDGNKYMEVFGGDFSQYTLVPPSLRAPDEPLTFSANRDITHVPETGPEGVEAFRRRLLNYAIAVVLYRAFGPRNVIHAARLPLAGFLLKEGLEEEDVEVIGRAVTEATGNDIHDWATAYQTTRDHLRASRNNVSGKKALIDQLGDRGKAVVRKIKTLLGGDEFVRNEHGAILPTSPENIRIALDKLDVVASFDAFAQKPYLQIDGAAKLLDDATWIPLWLRIEEVFGFLPPEILFVKVLRDAAWKNTFHPVLAYLDTLTWDEVPRLDRWLTTYGGAEDTPLTRSIASKHLIAAVRRVRKPGCKKDEMLVLESKQGKAKSTAIAALCPNVRWFSDDLPLGIESQQVIEATGGKWIIEAAELQNIRGKDIERLKAFLSRTTDGPVRLAYDRTATEVARQFLLIGTTNSVAYLKDSTGNRRFWPVKVGDFDVKALERDRDQLWAEAAHREAQGESHFLEEKLWPVAEAEQEKRRTFEGWETDVDEVLSNTKTDWIPVKSLWDILGIRASCRNQKHVERLDELVQRFGFVEKKKMRVALVIDGRRQVAKPMWCYVKEGFARQGDLLEWVADFDNEYQGEPGM